MLQARDKAALHELAYISMDLSAGLATLSTGLRLKHGSGSFRGLQVSAPSEGTDKRGKSSTANTGRTYISGGPNSHPVSIPE